MVHYGHHMTGVHMNDIRMDTEALTGPNTEQMTLQPLTQVILPPRGHLPT